VLKGLESGGISLDDGVDSKSFFAMLLQNTKEGYFSDPIYGGNRGMGPWRMIGFSGARYDQRAYVLAYGKPYPLPPVGIGGRPAWSAKG
jgi:gluconate 2-dehydrogenase gamma chain